VIESVAIKLPTTVEAIALNLISSIIFVILTAIAGLALAWIRDPRRKDSVFVRKLTDRSMILNYYSCDNDGQIFKRARRLTVARTSPLQWLKLRHALWATLSENISPDVNETSGHDFDYHGPVKKIGHTVVITAELRDVPPEEFCEAFHVQIDVLDGLSSTNSYVAVLSGLDYQKKLRGSLGILSDRVLTDEELKLIIKKQATVHQEYGLVSAAKK
jgi:hypothetical protein